MRYEALNDQVLLKRLDVDDSLTEGGLFKPEVLQVKSNKGEVIAVCKGETELKVGDIVLFSRSGADEVDLDGQEYILVHRKQIYLREKHVAVTIKLPTELSREV